MMKTKAHSNLFLFAIVLALAMVAVPGVAHADYTAFDTWYAQAKETAFSADHVVGPGGDIGDSSNSPYVVVMPGETIGVYPDASRNISNSAAASYATINYRITQFDKAVADYTYLPRSAKPKAVLTKVKSETVNIPYEEIGTLDKWREGGSNLKVFTYTSIYRNDTGLPILISYKKMGTDGPLEDGMVWIESNSPYYIQGRLTKTDGVVLSFLEPSYQISYKAAEVNRNGAQTGTVNMSELYWNNSTNTMPSSMPKAYLYTSNEQKTYTLLHPVLKGHTFSKWSATYIDEEGYEGYHPVALPVVSSAGDEYTTQSKYGFTIARSETTTVTNVNALQYQNKVSVVRVHAFDATATACFKKSDSSHTIGFNPEGGTVKGGKYYIVEDAGFNVNVNSIKPTRTGYTFDGWCTDKSRPAATKISNSGTGENVYGTTAANNHTELYAVWKQAGGAVLTTKISIAKATVTLSPASFVYDGKAKSPGVTVLLNGKTLKAGTDYTVSYKNNVNAGTATVTVTGKGDYTGSVSKTFTITEPAKIWYRLDGSSKFDTMRKIVGEGWSAGVGGTVIIATAFTYQDALSAASVAGKYKAPILVTDYYKLTSQTRAELDRLRPSNIIIVGGEYVVTPAVKNALQNLSYVKRVDRVAGAKASDTAAKVVRTYFPKGTTNTAILATSQDFRDALSASPIAYAKGYPIFLVDSSSSISNETLKAMKDCGITRVVIVGGKYVVSPTLESKLRSNGVSTIERKAGDHYWDTSHDIAQWGLTLGMSANNMGVATGYDYSDALCGAPLCGKNNAVLVLTEHNRAHNTDIPKNNKAKIVKAYVFGGKNVVQDNVMASFENATK